MPFVSLTRLRIRSVRFMPGFALSTMRSLRQVKRASGFQRGGLLPDRSWTFWTLTMWDSETDMRRYMVSGSHKAAMPHLLNWCDEASVAHWEQPGDELPSWEAADLRMRASGRASKVLHPSAARASLSYRKPRTTRAVGIERQTKAAG